MRWHSPQRRGQVIAGGREIHRRGVRHADLGHRRLAGRDRGPTASALIRSLRADARAFTDIGLGYLSLDRSAGSLSGGEGSGVKLVRRRGSPVSDVTCVCADRAVGVHPDDTRAMSGVLLALRDEGYTVVVVEHTPGSVLIADHVVDLGPGAGSSGGE